MSKCLSNNLSKKQGTQPAMLAGKELFAHAMAPVHRVVNSIFLISVFVVVGLWLSGNGTNAGPFDLARLLVPDEARNIFWSNGFGMLDKSKDTHLASNTQSDDLGIAAVLYSQSSPAAGLLGAKQQTIALLMPSVAQLQVKSISHLADRIPSSKIDPQALDTNLMGSIHNQRAIADFFEKKYNLDRAKIEEYVSNTVLIAKEVNIDPVLLLAVISIESNFNPNTKSHAGAEGLMQVMTAVHKEKYALFGGISDAVKPEVNIRVGAYILKYLIATGGSLRNGLKYYVGAANAEDDGGYSDKVMAERNRLIGICEDRANNRLSLNGKNLRS
jgi:soluble lytic murein transglycosylase-like protein